MRRRPGARRCGTSTATLRMPVACLVVGHGTDADFRDPGRAWPALSRGRPDRRGPGPARRARRLARARPARRRRARRSTRPCTGSFRCRIWRGRPKPPDAVTSREGEGNEQGLRHRPGRRPDGGHQPDRGRRGARGARTPPGVARCSARVTASAASPRATIVDLSALSEADLRRFADTPNSGLGSTRDKPDEAYCERIVAGLQKVDADAFIYIGGNDTAGTMGILDQIETRRDALHPCAEDDRQRPRRERPHAGLHLGGVVRRRGLPLGRPRFPRHARHLCRHRHGPACRLPHRRGRRLAPRERDGRAASGLCARRRISRRRS